MNILIYNLPYLDVEGKKVYEFDDLYEEIDKNYDVLIVNFEYLDDFLEIKKYHKGSVVFMYYYSNHTIYKRALENGDYFYTYDELYKLQTRLEYLRKKLKKSEFFRYGDLFFDIKNERVFKNREEISLTNGEKEVLKILVQNKNRYITKFDIMDMTDYIENENSVKVLISRLRKLGFEIETLKNQGYKIKEKQ